MKYVVGIYSHFGEDLELFTVLANSPYQAILEGIMNYANKNNSLTEELDSRKFDNFPNTVENLLDWYYDQDLIVNYIEVD